MPLQPRIAYFSMEIGVDAEMRTYSGGLGVLAGDTIRAAADHSVPMVAVTLLHRRGYGRQVVDEHGNQIEEPVAWPFEKFVCKEDVQTTVQIEDRQVQVVAWKRDVEGVSGFRVPVLFLDTDIDGNDERDRALTHHLYGGDQRYRFCQEVILGIGGVRILRALGFNSVVRFHMNEGHSSLLGCELLREITEDRSCEQFETSIIDFVRNLCVFTTHTPVPSGHDVFPADMVRHVVGQEIMDILQRTECVSESLNLTELALYLSRYVNGVARRHGEISRKLFSVDAIDSITNGVHVRTWAARPIQELFDKYIPTWKGDSFSLRNALAIPTHEIWRAHERAKLHLIDEVKRRTGVGFDLDVFTIGFARRATPYKRLDLFFHDLNRLRRIHSEVGRFQVVCAGKAHPHDHAGKEMIRRICDARSALRGQIQVAFVPDYGMRICQSMIAGCDLWLNTPEPPMEASGTSGMKAAMNGVPSLSVLDGWWLEGWVEGTTGWAIGRPSERPDRDQDARNLYGKLEFVILPLFYQEREEFVSIMRHCISLNGSYFNAHRMIHQYVVKAYFV